MTNPISHAALALVVISSFALLSCDRDQSSLGDSKSQQPNLSKPRKPSRESTGPGTRKSDDDKSGYKSASIEVRNTAQSLGKQYQQGELSVDELLNIVLAAKNDEEAAIYWQELLKVVRREDIGTFFSSLRENGTTGVKAAVLPQLVARADSLDPSLADQIIEQLPEGALRTNCVLSLFGNSPESILQHAALIATLTSDRDGDVFGIGYIDALKQLKSDDLIAFLSKLPDGRAKSQAMKALAFRLGEESSSLADLSGKLSKAKCGGNELMGEAYLRNLETKGGDDFSRISLTTVAPEQQSALAYATATMLHRTSSPKAAMNWLWKEGDGNPAVVRKGIYDTMVRWLESDPIAASQWMSEQPIGPLGDIALGPMVDYLDKPAERSQRSDWAHRFSDPKLGKKYSQ